MALRKCLLILTASAFAAPAFAAPPTLSVNSPSSAQNLAQGTANPIVITFNNSTAATPIAAGFQFRLAYNNAAIAFPVLTGAQVVSSPSGIVCNQFNATTLSCGGFSGAGDFPAVVTVTIGTQTLAGPSSSPLSMTNFQAFDGNGDPIAGATAGAAGTYTVTGGVVVTGPSIAYNPAAGGSAGTGGPVNFTGVTTVGSVGAGQIVATPSGGAGAGTTTVGSFALTGADAANFAVTSAATLTFTAGTNTPQNINLTCQAGAAARTANLQATETITGGATSQRFWVLSCPAGVAGATPPTLTYNPVAGSTTNVAAGANTVISVGCPNDGAACGGSGSGLAATSRLESLSAAFTGAASPQPIMVCSFVTEGGVVLGGSTLDFVATQADPGDIRCTCPINTTSLPEPFRVSVSERIPASGGVTATRTFDLVCGAPPPNCGNIVAANQSPGSIVALTNGGAATQVTALSLVGASTGVSQTATCVVSGASAGSTFTVTTAPTPLVLSTIPAQSGTVSATCTNSATTTASATVTCSFASNNSAVCANGNPVQFTLNCPGAGGPPPPPPVNFIPVPSLTEQGRILLAALVLLMGLGVVGFRMRG